MMPTRARRFDSLEEELEAAAGRRSRTHERSTSTLEQVCPHAHNPLMGDPAARSALAQVTQTNVCMHASCGHLPCSAAVLTDAESAVSVPNGV